MTRHYETVKERIARVREELLAEQAARRKLLRAAKRSAQARARQRPPIKKATPSTWVNTDRECGDLEDYAGGWEDYVLIYAGGIVTSPSLSIPAVSITLHQREKDD